MKNLRNYLLLDPTMPSEQTKNAKWRLITSKANQDSLCAFSLKDLASMEKKPDLKKFLMSEDF